jgi:hypothetical protein
LSRLEALALPCSVQVCRISSEAEEFAGFLNATPLPGVHIHEDRAQVRVFM